MTLPVFEPPATLPPALAAEAAPLAARFDEAAAAAGIARRTDAELAAMFAASPFLAEVAIRRPAEFDALLADAALATPRSRADYDRLVAAELAGVDELAAAKRALRRLRNLEMVRLAWRDIRLGGDVLAIMAELSAFADAVVAGALGWLETHLAPRFGQAFDADGSALQLVVIGMGKLGGGELNFSSDIDLLFVYRGRGVTRGGRRELELQDYFNRLGRELIGLLNETTADGFVFRVDMRLRPFGDSGPLTTSLTGLEHYYAAHGRDWERYALIKGRAITGDTRTLAELDDIVRPFVYRRYLDFGALEALREMKQSIDREASSRQLVDDLKRGRGGIREIEFTGQLFQLIRGGREPRLRDRSLVATLEACADLGLIERDTVTRLVAAYRFLRTAEHRLQQVRDRQTHSVPGDPLERERLAFALGFADFDAFRAALDTHREATRAHFRTLLEAPDRSDEQDDALAAWRDLWQADGDAAALAEHAAEAGLAAGEGMLAVVAELRAERFLARLSSHGRARLDRLMPLLLARAQDLALADAALRRIANLLHAIARRSVYVAFLADNPGALDRLLQLFAASPWIAEQITAQPLLLDELLDPRVLYTPPDRARLDQLVAAQVRPGDGLEQGMENLRAFRNQQVLRVAASDITGNFPVAEVSNQLTDIAEACIVAALDLAWREVVARYGEPCCDDGAGTRTAGFAIIAYGKLGGLELGYGSDLDLVFLNDSTGSAQHTNGAKSIENGVFFTRLVQRFIHILSTNTPSGVAYEVDTRLRPSGSAGMMVISTTAYARYLSDEAWVWEHQALVRARGIAGSAGVLERFAAIRAEVLARSRSEDELACEIVAMRARMRGELDRSGSAGFDLKQGAGGITDIEFMVQYAVLRWAGEHPELLAWTDNLRLLETIADLALLPAESCRHLHDAYFAYRAALHRCTLQQVDAVVEAERFGDHRASVVGIWEQLFGSAGTLE